MHSNNENHRILFSYTTVYYFEDKNKKNNNKNKKTTCKNKWKNKIKKKDKVGTCMKQTNIYFIPIMYFIFSFFPNKKNLTVHSLLK